MDTATHTITLAACRGTIRRRIQRQFLESLTAEQREMYLATTPPVQNRRVQLALADLIASMDLEFPSDDRG